MSRRALVLVWLAVAIPLVLIATGVITAAAAGGKDYHFPRVTIDARVDPDGSLELDERRTFAFRGVLQLRHVLNAAASVGWSSG